MLVARASGKQKSSQKDSRGGKQAGKTNERESRLCHHPHRELPGRQADVVMMTPRRPQRDSGSLPRSQPSSQRTMLNKRNLKRGSTSPYAAAQVPVGWLRTRVSPR